ncbi:MAG: aminomethyl-transferring glycine dehydrogenase subunit GcvPA [Bacillota bacterium]|jgi:glycine dehydrogenase subunit 1
MTSYVPNPAPVREEMLRQMGLDSVDALFADIPSSLRIAGLDLPRGMSELELQRHLTRLARKNLTVADYPTFLGAGAYDHYIPVAVDQLLLRSEFYTAYTPYQAEISQGILQSIYEYQSMICTLTDMDVSNASVYDGATALAEACNVAAAATRRQKLIVPETLHPAYRRVLETYARSGNYSVQVQACPNGQIDETLIETIDRDTAAVVVQYPNFYGVVEQNVPAIADAVHAQKGLLIMVVDPIALGLLTSPGELGADLVVGEGQALGMPLSFGGPYLGFLASTDKLMRRIPGRLVGETVDAAGERAFVLTLQAREQHIRRERASSNICSNQALNALAATIYLTLVGPRGLQEIALRSHQLAVYAQQELARVGVKLKYEQPFFKEFAVTLADPADANRRLLEKGIIGGYELADGMLLAFTEKRTRDEIDRLVNVLGGKM